jgi:alkylation response protein AidB-like acyl-CoA dehydrogenase
MPALSDSERDEFRDSARRLLTDRSSSRHVRAVLDDDVGFDRSLWSSMAELGWFAVHIAEPHGGMGASYGDLAVIVHELGRQMTPAPVLGSVVVGAEALIRSANGALAAELLPALASGEAVLAAALAGGSGSYAPGRVTVACTTAGRTVFDGVARFVLDADVADYLVVAAVNDGGGITLGVIDRTARGVEVHVEPTFDRTRRLARVSFDRVVVDDSRLLGSPGADTALFDRLVAIGAIGAIGDAVGAAERILEISNAYAKERIQFGRPIGSFQAVKHHLANMFVDVEASRAAAAIAVDALDGDGDLRSAAAIAKSFAGPACARVAHTAVQVHGGIGFTWEHDAHLYLKRIRLDEALFGTPSWHREYLAAELLDGERPT